jgi:transcriptional regulator with XRE-family HTH domain
METFGDRLRRYRIAKGLSLDELAASTGLSKAYLWKLEKKPDVNPSVDVAQKLAVAVGTTLAELISASLEGEPHGVARIPPSLLVCKEHYKLNDNDVYDLSRIRFRGAHPTDADGWYLLYLQLKRIVSDDEP